MNSSVHTIRKQTLQFQYNGNADGFALQKEVSDWCNFTLIPEIEQQLDSLDPGENFVTIDKLEIEATVDSNDWKQKIRDELILSLKQKLSDYKPRFEEETSNKGVSRARKLDELILYYFENGYLPWWGKAMITDDFETVLQNWSREELSPSRAKSIIERLKQTASKNQIERILNQVPHEQFFQLLKNIYKEAFEILGQLESFFKKVILDNISHEKEKLIKKSFHSRLLKMAIKNKGEIDSYSILQFVYKELKAIHISEKILTPQSVTIEKPDNPVILAWHELLFSETKKQKRTTENEASTPKKQPQDEIEAEEITKEKQLRYNKIIDQLINPDLAKNRKDELVTELQEGIYIDNAGAVIFAAFVPALFKQLGLEKDGVILNPDLGTMIIQYCVTGNTKIAEYELVLPKILCGLDIEFPVNTNTEIAAHQLNEVDEMLLSLIEYWPVLKNTSINGLRESFLKRNGKLSRMNNEWLLQVEQKSFDMLLQQLPWSISMIRLPWMKNLLKTEWV
jgi:hypothetical protein